MDEGPCPCLDEEVAQQEAFTEAEEELEGELPSEVLVSASRP